MSAAQVLAQNHAILFSFKQNLQVHNFYLKKLF